MVLFIMGNVKRSHSHTIVHTHFVCILFEHVMLNKITFYFVKCFCS